MARVGDSDFFYRGSNSAQLLRLIAHLFGQSYLEAMLSTGDLGDLLIVAPDGR